MPTRLRTMPVAPVLLVLLALGGCGTSSAWADEPTGWGWPLDGRPAVVRGFDPPARPWSAGHRGVDLRAGAGAVVRAAGPGTVSFAGTIAGRGVVVVAHGDGTRTTYEPVSAGVRPGTVVARGAPLGRLTPGGGHCLPVVCLHWGRLRGNSYLDPLALVSAGPVRLLPVWDEALPSSVRSPPHRAVGAAAAGGPDGSTRAAPSGAGWGSPTALRTTLLPLLVLGAAALSVRRRRRARRPRPGRNG